MKICICGSTKFKDKTIELAEKLTLEGHIVLKSEIFRHKRSHPLTDSEITMLTMVHAQKILEADLIYIVDIDGYVGDTTKVEIEFAEANGKQVRRNSNWEWV